MVWNTKSSGFEAAKNLTFLLHKLATACQMYSNSLPNSNIEVSSVLKSEKQENWIHGFFAVAVSNGEHFFGGTPCITGKNILSFYSIVLRFKDDLPCFCKFS